MMPYGRSDRTLANAELPGRAQEAHHMAMPATVWTTAMARALPDDGKRYEVIDGELFVTPAPTLLHQRAAGLLYELLAPYARAQSIGETLMAPADVLTTPHVTVQPDVFVAPLIDGRRPASWDEVRTLVLAVEVLSPSTARADRQVKRRLYQRERVAEYWIVDVDARLIERWRPDDERPEILVAQLEWKLDPARPPLVIDLPAYFRDVIGE
jgi:Uma2 family endonuclease